MARPLKIPLFLVLFCMTPILASAQSAPLRLTLSDAIHRGLQSNLGVLVAETRVQEAVSISERRQSLLLPRVEIQTPVAVQSRSLKAMGISVPGLPLPDLVGLYSTYEARAYADQPIVNLPALHTLRSARLSTASARSDYQDARDLVIHNVAALYLSAQAEFAEVIGGRIAGGYGRKLFINLPQNSAMRVWLPESMCCARRYNWPMSSNRLCSRATVPRVRCWCWRAISGCLQGRISQLADPLEFRPAISVVVETRSATGSRLASGLSVSIAAAGGAGRAA